VVEYAHGKPLSEILGVSYRKDGKIVHNALRPQLHTEELDALPFATDIYKRDLEIERYNVPFLLHPMCRSTPRADARRFARSACGRKRFRGMRGERVRRKTWRGK